MSDKRILVTEVYGGCRNLRVLEEGVYCAADQIVGWELINPSECDNCKRKKQFVGFTREKLIELMAKTIDDSIQGQVFTAEGLANAVLNAMLGKGL